MAWPRFGSNGMRYRFVAVSAFALALQLSICPGQASDSPKRVLVLFSYNIATPTVMSVGLGAIDRLTDKSRDKLELASEFLDLARFPDADHESRTARYL